MLEDRCDVLVIGGGIAGTSIAYELASDQEVLLLEKEDSLGKHATGRSAAMYLATYGGRQVRALTATSFDFFTTPPAAFKTALVKPRPLLQVARAGRGHLLERLFEEVQVRNPGVRLVSASEIVELCDIVEPGCFESGLYEADAMELEVHELQSGYAHGLRDRGGRIETGSEVSYMRRREHGWEIRTATGKRVIADIVVNAAGAWADQVATAAGHPGIGLQARRRSAFILSIGTDDMRNLPLLYDVDESYYLKPEGVDILCSPADAAQVQPGDAVPSDLEIARALDEVLSTTSLTSRRVKASWAGLRTFAPDNEFAFGFDPIAPGFFWFAGQGGYGIQTAPAAARLGANIVRGRGVPNDIFEAGLIWSEIDVARFR